MSERVSSVEIEDVLSSIRRLVSEELRPMRPTGRPVAVAAAEAEFEEEPEAVPVVAAPPAAVEDRLVLTASLRVAPSKSADAPIAPAQATADAPPSQAGPDIWQDAETWEESWEQEGEDPLAGASWATSAPDAASAAASNEDDEPADALPPAPGHRFSFSVARSAFDEDEAPDPAADPADGAKDPDSRLELTADLAISSPPWAQPVAGDRDRDTAAPRTPPVRPAAPEDAAWADAAAAEAIRHVEAGIADDDTAAREDPIRTVPPSTSGAELPTARVSYLHRAEPGPQSGALDDPDDAPEELILEEAALREIIREVVREELAGSLGGRITRNVRKLVRGEIARMLASRTME